MKLLALLILSITLLSACVVVPETDTAKVNKCEISSDRKTLKLLMDLRIPIPFIQLVALYYSPYQVLFLAHT